MIATVLATVQAYAAAHTLFVGALLFLVVAFVAGVIVSIVEAVGKGVRIIYRPQAPGRAADRRRIS